MDEHEFLMMVGDGEPRKFRTLAALLTDVFEPVEPVVVAHSTRRYANNAYLGTCMESYAERECNRRFGDTFK